MTEKEDYLKAKQIVQEYEKQLNISDVIGSSIPKLPEPPLSRVLREKTKLRGFDNITISPRSNDNSNNYSI